MSNLANLKNRQAPNFFEDLNFKNSFNFYSKKDAEFIKELIKRMLDPIESSRISAKDLLAQLCTYNTTYAIPFEVLRATNLYDIQWSSILDLLLYVGV